MNDLNDVVRREGCSSTQEHNFIGIAGGDDAEIRLVLDSRKALAPADCNPNPCQLVGGLLITRRDLGRGSEVESRDVRLDEERVKVCAGDGRTVRQAVGPHV